MIFLRWLSISPDFATRFPAVPFFSLERERERKHVFGAVRFLQSVNFFPPLLELCGSVTCFNRHFFCSVSTFRVLHFFYLGGEKERKRTRYVNKSVRKVDNAWCIPANRRGRGGWSPLSGKYSRSSQKTPNSHLLLAISRRISKDVFLPEFLGYRWRHKNRRRVRLLEIRARVRLFDRKINFLHPFLSTLLQIYGSWWFFLTVGDQKTGTPAMEVYWKRPRAVALSKWRSACRFQAYPCRCVKLPPLRPFSDDFFTVSSSFPQVLYRVKQGAPEAWHRGVVVAEHKGLYAVDLQLTPPRRINVSIEQLRLPQAPTPLALDSICRVQFPVPENAISEATNDRHLAMFAEYGKLDYVRYDPATKNIVVLVSRLSHGFRMFSVWYLLFFFVEKFPCLEYTYAICMSRVKHLHLWK